jgi:hypothetical protein
MVNLVADQGVRAATSDHSWRLIGQLFGWINDFGLQRNLVPYMLTELDLADFPRAEGHSNLQMMSQVYAMCGGIASDTRHL